jgi:hypothetical protein
LVWIFVVVIIVFAIKAKMNKDDDEE